MKKIYYNNCTFTASHKLQINGSSLVLEKDGTCIEDSEVLLFSQNDVLLLLTRSENWLAASEQAFLSLNNTLSHNETEMSEIPVISIPADETVCSEEPSLLSAPVETNCLIRWDDFKIPWEMLSPSTLASYQSGQSSWQQYQQFVKLIIDRMKELSSTLTTDALKIVAKKAASKYPQTFQDRDDDGKVISDGIFSLLDRMKGRYFNLLSKMKRSSTNKTSSSHSWKSKKAKKGPNENENNVDENENVVPKKRFVNVCPAKKN